MTVRIGDVELTGLQAIYAVENRSLVEQRVPGRQGNVTQDLGREPVTLRLEGWLAGEDAADAVEKLRAAHSGAEARSFAADIAVGSDLVDVIIRDLDIRQPAGWRDRYWFEVLVREHQEPPEPAGAGNAAVEAGITADADAWSANTTDALGALSDPGALAGLLDGNPDLLGQLDMGDFASSLQSGLEDLTGLDLQGVMDAIKKIDPQKVIDLVNKLKDADSLSDVLGVLADEGLDLFEDITGIDTGMLDSIVGLATGGLDFIKQAKNLGEAIVELVEDITDFDPTFGKGRGSTAKDIVLGLDEVAVELDALLKTDTAQDIANIIKDLGLGDQVTAVTEQFDNGLTTASHFLDEHISPILRQLQALKGLLRLLDPLMAAAGHLVGDSDELLAQAGLGETLRPTDEIGDLIKRGRGLLDNGADLLDSLPENDDLQLLRGHLEQVGETFTGFAAETQQVPA